jgi:hypothetical protein
MSLWLELRGFIEMLLYDCIKKEPTQRRFFQFLSINRFYNIWD